MALFDYDSLLAGALYQGTYLREPDNPESERNVSHVGKYLGMDDRVMLKILKDPDGKIRQVPLLCDDPKYGAAIRFFEPETLVLVEDNNG